MEKKTKQQDVLVVRDEKTGEVSVVAGLDSKGYPKRVPPKQEHFNEFLKFDKSGDMLDNFMMNFLRQCREPTRFGFYRLAAEQAEQLLGVMKELLKDPKGNKDLLSPHKVDAAPYEQAVKQEQTSNSQDMKEKTTQDGAQQETATVQERAQEKKNGYQPIDESRIDWKQLETQLGISREALERSGDLRKMLNYGKSGLVRVTPEFEGVPMETAARLSFVPRPDGQVKLDLHLIRKEANLDLGYKGHQFSEDDKRNLKTTGNLGRIVDLVDRETGEVKPSFISIDRLTNEITDIAVNKVHLRDTIGKSTLSETEKSLLLTGAPLKDKLIELENGRKFTVTLQVNVEQRGAEFVPGTSRSVKDSQTQKQDGTGEQKAVQPRERENRWTTEDGKIRPISKWKNINFTDQQKQDYRQGKTVKLENVLDKQGQPCTMYLKFNMEKGRPFTHSKNPDEAQRVAPSNESRTQVAVNDEGKTNEATKHVQEPLQKGQVAPKDGQEQSRQEARKPSAKKSKGIGM